MRGSRRQYRYGKSSGLEVYQPIPYLEVPRDELLAFPHDTVCPPDHPVPLQCASTPCASVPCASVAADFSFFPR